MFGIRVHVVLYMNLYPEQTPGTCGQILESMRWVMMSSPLDPVDKG
jgi:hypothetical protein